MISQVAVSADVTALRAFALRAFAAWGNACEVLADRRSALRPSASCIAEAGQIACELRDRYQELRDVLATETGGSAVSIDNEMAALLAAEVSDEERMIEEAYRAWGGDERAYQMDLI